MAKVLVPIANGSEDIESVTIIDVLRRAGLDVVVASVHEHKQVTAARGCRLEADSLIEDVKEELFDAIVLPGGMPGAEHLRDCQVLVDMLERHDIQDKLLAAVCASPAVVFGSHGFVMDKKATCYPGFESGMTGAEVIQDRPVVQDGNILTSQGPATAMAFSLGIVAELSGFETAQKVAEGLLCG